MAESTETFEAAQASVVERLIRVVSEGGSDNRLVLQGDRGYLLVKGEYGESDVLIKAAAGRSLDRVLNEDEVSRLYHAGFRRKNAALPFERVVTIEHQAQRIELAQEMITLFCELYASHLGDMSLQERFTDQVEINDQRLREAMRRLSKQRDMSARQKVYWAVVRADVLLALSEPPPQSLYHERGRAQWVESGLDRIENISSSVSLQSFAEVTGYRSAAIFSTQNALEATDPRGINWVRLPGKLAISLALAQGWDSLLINPYNQVGGEFYRNELMSIMEGLKQFDR